MGRAYRSAQGKSIDMDRMKLVNEKTIAVGNMKVNARGDQLGAGGQVVQTRNQVADQQYRVNSSATHQQRVAEVRQTQIQAGAANAQGQATVTPVVPDVDPSGVSFDPPDVDQVPVSTEPQMRGSLADSIAKQATVTQELLDPNMHKPKGPQRI